MIEALSRLRRVGTQFRPLAGVQQVAAINGPLLYGLVLDGHKPEIREFKPTQAYGR